MESAARRHAFATTAVTATQIHNSPGAVAPPLYLSTTFERSADGTYPTEFEYSRESNPNRTALEAALSMLEGGADAAVFASGSAALMTLFLSLGPNDHVIAPRDMYFGIHEMLAQTFSSWGLSVTFVDVVNVSEIESAIRPNTCLIFVETPSNPMLKVADLRAIVDIARAHDILMACDNTLATPVFQSPLALGCDLVTHSTTKYISGHHDAHGGALITAKKDAYWERIRFNQRICGPVSSPFSDWLTLRGIASLACRAKMQNDTALRIAEHLNAHPHIEQVLHPGLASHPQHVVASAQMSGFGALFSILVRGDAQRAIGVTKNVKLFKRATSFGGPESLIEHRASIEGPASSTPPNLLRLAIGLEDSSDLIEDLEQALSGR